MRLPKNLTWGMAQSQWPQVIDPVVNNQLNQGQLIGPIALISGTNVINHKLGRNQLGWIITDQDAASSIYRNAVFNNLTLSLSSSAPCNISLWVF